MTVLTIVKALLVGFVAGIPIGPVGILCIQKTLNKGMWNGFATGLGSAIMEIIYAAVALFSMAFVAEFIQDNRDWVMIIGGLVIIFVGISTFFKNPVDRLKGTNIETSGRFTDSLQGFLLTLSNPGALVIMLSLFAFAGIDPEAFDTKYTMGIMIFAVFIGESTWWLVLSSGVNHFRKKFSLRGLLLLNRISGSIIAVLGLAAFFEGIYEVVFLG
ncbi:MAG: LysE family transporter [Bacteroidales bacterium]|nr:LysE family transporter [Bacteroidales bacterium]